MIRRIVAIVVLILLRGVDLAHASPAEATLSLRQAVELALERNPTFAAQRAELEGSRARADSLVLGPPYRVGVELENFAGSGGTSGADNLEATLTLSGVLELGGKRDARRALGALQVDALQLEQRVRLLDVVAAVALRFVAVVEAEARIRVAVENTTLAARTLESVAKRVTAARASRAELAKAQIALIHAELREREANSGLAAARATLASAWGDEHWTFGTTLAELYQLPRNASLAELHARLEQAPDLSLIASRARLEQARARLVTTARRADVGWSAGLRRLEAPGDQAFVIGVELPLGTVARAALQQREAAAELERLRYDARARRNELRSTVFAAYQNLEQARVEATTLRDRSTPLAEEALRLTELGYHNGRYSLLELADAQTQLLEVRSETIGAASAFFRVLIELERLTGTNIVETFPGA